MNKNKLINEIKSIALNADRDLNLLANVNTSLGCRRYVDDFSSLSDFIDKDAKVLDLGCGVGHISYILARQGFLNITASEISEPTPLYVQNFNNNETSTVNIDYIAANILQNNHALSDKKFDAVIICGVLEHVPDMHKFLKKIFSLLSPGGKLFIFQFPNKYSIFEKMNDYMGKSSHDIRLSKYELGLLATFSEFKVIQKSYHQFLPYTLARFPGIIQKAYFSLDRTLRLIDRIMFSTPLLNTFSTSIKLVGKKSTSCKS